MGKVIYEVQIDVVESRADEYWAWLKAHSEEMRAQLHGIEDIAMSCRGAVAAPADAAAPAAAWRGFTVRYKVASREQVDDYIVNRAPAMRQHAIEKFGVENMRGQRSITDVAE